MTENTTMTVANEQAFEYWNGATADHWVKMQPRFDAMMRRQTPRLLEAAALRSDHVVVDVGCGVGETSRLAARRARRVLGVDLSARMIARAASLAREEGLANAAFVQGDAQTYPFPPAATDVVLSRFGAMDFFFVDPVAAYRNLRGALRTGGRLVLLCWQGARANETVTVLAGVLASMGLLEAIGGEIPEELGPFSMADPARMRDRLDAAGFVDVAVEPVTEPLWLGETADAAVELLNGTGLARILLDAADPATAERAWQAIAAELDRRRSPDGIWLGSAAWLVTARR
jgi:SAM-dependent methyltransferase